MKYKYIFDIEEIERSDFIAKSAIIFYTQSSIKSIRDIFDKLTKRYQNIKCIGIETFDIRFVEFKIYKIRYYNYVVVLYRDSFDKISLWSSANIKNIRVENRDKSYLAFSSLGPDSTELAIERLNLSNIYGMVSNNTIFYQGEFFEDTFLIANFRDYHIDGLSINEFDTIKLGVKLTKATNNIIKEIEYTPAVEFMKNTMGEFDKNSISEFRTPLIISDKRDKNLYKLTSILDMDIDKKYIYVHRYVKSGMNIDIGVLTDKKELLKRKNSLKIILKKRELNYILFTCMGIDRFWKNLMDIRLIEIADILKRDLLSVFGYGEIGKIEFKSKSMFLNQTYTLISIFEE